MKRPPNRRQLRGILLLLLTCITAILVAGLILWVLPAWLTERPHPTKTDRITAINNARTGIVAFVAALGALVGLAFTALTYRLSLAGHVTDRYTKAVEQLGSDQPSVRIGGIYALERLTRNSPADQPSIVEVITAFVRERSPWPPQPRRHARSTSTGGATSPEVSAAVAVLRRRQLHPRERPLNLARTDLTGVDLHDADLTAARFDGANLTDATLAGAVLRESHLEGAVLDGTNMYEAKLAAAILYRDQENQLTNARETDRVVWKDRP